MVVGHLIWVDDKRVVELDYVGIGLWLIEVVSRAVAANDDVLRHTASFRFLSSRFSALRNLPRNALAESCQIAQRTQARQEEICAPAHRDKRWHIHHPLADVLS